MTTHHHHDDLLRQAEAAAASRKQDIHDYFAALNASDFDTMTVILQRAETDPELEYLIWDLHIQIAKAECDMPASEESRRVREMVQHLLKQEEDRKP